MPADISVKQSGRYYEPVTSNQLLRSGHYWNKKYTVTMFVLTRLSGCP